MSADGDEVALTGGAQTEGIVRVGATVRRPRHARSDRARTVLLELAAAGFTGAPTHLGFDERDREILGFVEGSVPAGPPYNLSDARLRSAAELIREFHDVASRLPSRGEQETLCHGDLGAHNTVFRGERAVAIIDWDSVMRSTTCCAGWSGTARRSHGPDRHPTLSGRGHAPERTAVGRG